MHDMPMENFVKDIKHHIDIEIQRIEQQQTDALDKIKQIVDALQTALMLLKSSVRDYQFKSAQEEIHFFKVLKPEISCLLIYYVRLYQIERQRKGKSASAQCKYLKTIYESLKKPSADNGFCAYYQSGHTELDELYFTREQYDILSDTRCPAADRDASFSTLHDASVAEILAGNRLSQYLSQEISSLSEELHLQISSIIESHLLQWTESKVSLVEFIYALHASQCFNHGHTSLKDIAFCCETLFHIEIGDFYRIFLEIRNRKKSRTQFLDKLKEKLIRMMEELDR